MKLSNSGLTTYTTCGESYRLQYVEGIDSQYSGSALFFGRAIDEGLNYMLSNKDDKNVLADSIKVFNTHWENSLDRENKATYMPTNTYVLYSKYDFDGEILEKKDWAELFKRDKNFFDTRDHIQTLIREVGFENIKKEYQELYNYSSWLSLSRKGPILITGYFEQLLPKIKRVIDVQKTFSLDDGNGNMLNGVIDFVCELQDGTICVADNKTSSIDYIDESVKTSQQLSLYNKVLNIFNEDPTNEWKVGHINHAAYFVMYKRLDVETTKVCSQCGHVGQGSHKTCDNTIEGKRCGGEWNKTKKINVKTDLIVDTIPEATQDMIVENANNVKDLINKEIYTKNFNSCHGKFGRCKYFEKCWYGKDDNLKRTKGIK